MKMNGASILIQSLIDQGIDTVFGYPGGTILPLYDELFQQDKLKHILVRHEQAAVHAAVGYARSTGKIGVVFVTSGPGAANTITGLADALADSVPVLCISGQVPTPLIGNDAFQEADIIGITSACTKHNYLIKDIEILEKTTKEAIYIATTGRPGPVLIDFPKDIQTQKTEYKNINNVTRPSYNVQIEGDQSAVEKAVEMIANAEKPIFYTGGGIINAGRNASELLTKLVKTTGYPITSTLMGLGAYPGSDQQFLGMPGMHGTVEANMAMAECDVMINIGARFDDRVTGRLDKFSQDSKKIHIDIDPSSINKNVKTDLSIIGDAGRILEQIIEEWEKKKYTVQSNTLKTWWEKIEIWKEKTKEIYERKRNDKGVRDQYVLEELNTLLQDEENFYITTDVGQHQMWAAQRIEFNKPNKLMTSGGLGTMGYGLPAAIGVQIAHPEAKVICISGDSSILMNIQELSTAKQHNTPIKILILNNGYMGMVRQQQELFHENRYSQCVIEGLPDFAALAKSFGAKSITCKSANNISKCLKEMLETEGTVVLEMQTEREDNVFPMITAEAAHYELLTGFEEKPKKETGEEND